MGDRSRAFMKKAVAGLLSLFFFPWTLPSGLSAQEAKKVLLVYPEKLGYYEQAAASFRRCLSQKSPGTTFESLLTSSDNQSAGLPALVAAKKPALVVAVGTGSSKSLMGKIPFPMVHCMFFDPEAREMPSATVSLEVNPSEQATFIRKSFPGVQKVGVIHHPQNYRRMVQGLKDAFQSGGMKTAFLQASQMAEVESGVTTLKGQDVDILLMLPDPTLYPPQALPQFILNSLQKGMPLVGCSPNIVKAGAVAGIFTDPMDNGCAAADLAARVLAGEKSESIPFGWSQNAKTAFNLIVAQRLGLRVNSSAVSAADQVFK